MGAYGYLLALALILLFTKIFGLATAHVHLPQVVGALIAGILLGPSGIGILHESDFLTKTAEIGVIMLLFIAGIDTDINELKHTGPAALLNSGFGCCRADNRLRRHLLAFLLAQLFIRGLYEGGVCGNCFCGDLGQYNG